MSCLHYNASDAAAAASASANSTVHDSAVAMAHSHAESVEAEWSVRLRHELVRGGGYVVEWRVEARQLVSQCVMRL